MKKWILGVLVVAVVVTIGFSLAKTYGLTNPANNDYPYYGMGHGHGYCYDDDEDDYDYEWLYLHLNEEDQALIDQMYAEALAEYDFTQMTDQEQADAIATVKADLVTYIMDNDLVDFW